VHGLHFAKVTTRADRARFSLGAAIYLYSLFNEPHGAPLAERAVIDSSETTPACPGFHIIAPSASRRAEL
jgi:hypothetical protein